MTAVRPFGLIRAGETDATSPAAFRTFVALLTAALSLAWGRLATTSNGPFEPGPKPFAIRS